MVITLKRCQSATMWHLGIKETVTKQSQASFPSFVDCRDKHALAFPLPQQAITEHWSYGLGVNHGLGHWTHPMLSPA